MFNAVLHTFSCDIAILQESKMEGVSHHIVVSSWGHHQVQWPFLFWQAVDHWGGIIVIWDPQVLKLINCRMGLFLYAGSSNPCPTILFTVWD